MAAAVRSKLQRFTSSGPGEEKWKAETERYKIYVTAGPSYDQARHQQVYVNTDRATIVENEFVKAKIKVRIRGYRGLPTTSPSHSSYFDNPIHERDMYSIAFSFVPKQDLPSLDTVWGNDFDHPIRERLPPGVNTAFRIVKEFIDPGLGMDAYADEPWLYGPSLSCWFAFRVGEKIDIDHGEDFPEPDQEVDAMKEGADGSGQHIRESMQIPETSDRRRKHFLSPANRSAFTFEKGRVYQGDFYNPYLDFGNFALKLPGFSLKVIKYVDQKSHCLRYVFKNKASGDVFFNVNIHLLWGQELQKALDEDREERRREEEEEVKGGAREDVMEVNGDAKKDEEHDEFVNAQEYTTEGPQLPEAQGQSGAGVEEQTTAPTTMQLHPGDHGASANSSIRQATADKGKVSEITTILEQTSTTDHRESKPNMI